MTLLLLSTLALADDPGADAPEAESAVGADTAPLEDDQSSATDADATEPMADPAPEPNEDVRRAWARYQRDRLVRGPLTSVSVDPDALLAETNIGSGSGSQSWTVRDGRGRQISVIRFAELTGDDAMVERAQKRVSTSLLGGGTIFAAGVAALIAGPVLAITNEEPAYLVAMPAGLMVMAGGIAWPAVTIVRHQQVEIQYTADDADALIESYNARIRDELGAPEEAP